MPLALFAVEVLSELSVLAVLCPIVNCYILCFIKEKFELQTFGIDDHVFRSTL